MLSYFEEKHTKINFLDAARNEIINFANKGLLPTWSDIVQSLPSCDEVSLQEVRNLFSKLIESSFLQRILSPDATEFTLHSPLYAQKVFTSGERQNFQLEIEMGDWQLWLEILSIRYKQNWNVEVPFSSFYGEIFNYQFRFTLIHESTSPQGISKLFLRRIANAPFKLEEFGNSALLGNLVRNKKNILIAGGTGSGKTSLLTSLTQFFNEKEHVVILEDTHEITANRPQITSLLSGESPQRSLSTFLTYALRMTPDRVIVGEMRSHEVVPYLLAMNTGHKGVMSTIHASSAVDALYRLRLLFSLYSSLKQESPAEIMELICRSLEFVVFMEDKKVVQIIQIYGSENGVPFYDEV